MGVRLDGYTIPPCGSCAGFGLGYCSEGFSCHGMSMSKAVLPVILCKDSGEGEGERLG